MTADELYMWATVIGSVLAFGIPAAWALSWAVSAGQFDNLERGASSIFDPDEPAGEVTDTTLGGGRNDG